MYTLSMIKRDHTSSYIVIEFFKIPSMYTLPMVKLDHLGRPGQKGLYIDKLFSSLSMGLNLARL